ncbi:MAG: NAD(P)-dependent alcohol dehydrogenase [Henriciella sp.]|uniref:NAD(P)-dependent alcohol dehydrogenase n=1 Tax=Henriciella sp. TaxID=1968823 RepID=UPI0032EE0941
MKAQAAIAYRGDDQFRIEEISVDDVRDDEILVKIAGVGLCHTDLVFKSMMADFPLPAVLGHEGSGVVLSVGRNITNVKPGDHVIITFRSCGACDRCGSGLPSYCRSMPKLNYTGRREDGSAAYERNGEDISSNFFGQSSFSELAITYERNVVKVDDDLPLEIMGPLGCGVQTGAGAIMRSLEAQPASSVLITGGGSVGLSAVMGAAICECSTIVLVEPHAARRELALDFGATHVIDPGEAPDLASALAVIAPAGFDKALDTSGAPTVQEAALACLAPKGVLGLVGISPPQTRLPGEVNKVMTFGHTVMGIIEGDSDPDVFLPELVVHFKAGRLPFDRMVKTYPLSQINEAVAQQHAGECIKAVLIPGLK